MKKNRVIVTGGAGFIGSHLVDLLVQEGHEVLVIDNLSTGQRHNISHDSSLYVADIRHLEEILPLFKQVDWVFHLAALADVVPSFENPLLYHAVNVTGTINVLEAARIHSVKKVIYAASSSCYGNPTQLPTAEDATIQPLSPYALTKYLAEQAALQWGGLYGFSVNCLRLFNVFGPRARFEGPYSSVVGTFLHQKQAKEPLTIVGDGKQTRDFVHVQDVAYAFYLAALQSCTGQIFNVGMGQEYSIKMIADLIDDNQCHLPARENEPKRSCAEPAKIKAMLGWQPKMTLQEGLKQLLR